MKTNSRGSEIRSGIRAMADVRTEIDLCCPECAGTLGWDRARGACLACGHAVILPNDHLVDFAGTDSAAYTTVMSWPDDFLDRVRPWLPALRSADPIPTEIRAELEAAGL